MERVQKSRNVSASQAGSRYTVGASASGISPTLKGGSVLQPVSNELNDPDALATDLLIGGHAIAKFCSSDWERGQIYYLARNCNFPIMRGVMGARYCARKSSIRAWFDLHENKKFKQLLQARAAEEKECGDGNA